VKEYVLSIDAELDLDEIWAFIAQDSVKRRRPLDR